jgi:Mn-dependent DtxR family transcriptional regulator
METIEKVWEYLKNEGDPKKAGEVAEALGIDKKEVDKAIKKLKKEERVESPKRCFYKAK